MGITYHCLCGRESPSDTQLWHPECDVEYDRRDDAGMCVLCDKHEQKPGFAKCAECVAAHNSTASGYPGGA